MKLSVKVVGDVAHVEIDGVTLAPAQQPVEIFGTEEVISLPEPVALTDGWTFLWFKESGKYYTEEKQGRMSEATFKIWSLGRVGNWKTEFLDALCEENGGHLPGLNGKLTDFAMVAFPHDSTAYGWPISLPYNWCMTK